MFSHTALVSVVIITSFFEGFIVCFLKKKGKIGFTLIDQYSVRRSFPLSSV